MLKETLHTRYHQADQKLFTIPGIYFTVSAHSEGFTRLNAFDNCLLDAGIGDTNIIKMSSIIPPGCTRTAPVPLPPGALVPAAYAYICSETPGEVIAAGVAVAVPDDESLAGLIMEYADTRPLNEVLAKVEEMAVRGFERRRRKLKYISTTGSEHRVVTLGAAFAGVVLWY
ncbi:MAG: pyruvoyl-dependent arginine decarboxylase [Spirochaetota bacterium]